MQAADPPAAGLLTSSTTQDWWTTRQAAQALGVHRNRVLQLVDAGQLHVDVVERASGRRRIRIDPRSVTDLVAERHRAAAARDADAAAAAERRAAQVRAVTERDLTVAAALTAARLAVRHAQATADQQRERWGEAAERAVTQTVRRLALLVGVEDAARLLEVPYGQALRWKLARGPQASRGRARGRAAADA